MLLIQEPVRGKRAMSRTAGGQQEVRMKKLREEEARMKELWEGEARIQQEVGRGKTREKRRKQGKNKYNLLIIEK